jgi:hypothetical protein
MPPLNFGQSVDGDPDDANSRANRMTARALAAALLPLLLWATPAAWAAPCAAQRPALQPGAAADLPQAAAAFGGAWQGQWPAAAHGHVVPVCARLNVQVLSPTSATVEQCTGRVPAARRKAECKRFAAQIDGNNMSFSDLQGTVYNFTVADVGGMKAEATSAAHRAVTVFTKPE